MKPQWDMSATEFLERLADALDSSRLVEQANVCRGEACGVAVRRGPYCVDCRRKRHAAAERARAARKRQEKAAGVQD